MKKSTENEVFITLIISYFIILFIPIAFGVFAYNKTLTSVEDSIEQQNFSILEQCKDTLDVRFNEVNSLMERLTIDKDIRRMMTIPNPLVQGDTAFTIAEIQNQVSVYKMNNNFISTFFIHFSNNDITISPDDTYININNFYGEFFKYSNMDYIQWRTEILDKYHTREYLASTSVTLKNQAQHMVACIQTIPIYGSLKSKGTIIMLISESNILKYMKDLNADRGSVYIIDDKNKLITSTSVQKDPKILNIAFTGEKGTISQEIDGKDMRIYYCVSKYNGWKYVSVLPQKVVMSKVYYIDKMAVEFLITFVLVGIIIAYAIAYRNSKPIGDIIRVLNSVKLNEKVVSKSSLTYMKNSVSALIANNEGMQKKIHMQQPLLQAMFLNKHLNGEFISNDEADMYFEQMGIVQSDMFAVVIIRVNSFNSDTKSDYLTNLNAIKILLKETVSLHVGQKVYSNDVDFDKIMMLMSFKDGEASVFKDRIEELSSTVHDILYSKYDIQVIFAAGNLVMGVANIPQSFTEAKSAMEYKIANKSSWLKLYSDVPKESKSYYYPADVETRLINFARSGNMGEIRNLIENIHIENFLERKLSMQMMKYLINDLNCTVVKLFYIIIEDEWQNFEQIRESILRLDDCDTEEEFFSLILSIYVSICEIIDTRKVSNNVKLKDCIIEYLNSNFMDPQMSLSSIGLRFRITEVYVSSFFKEQTGEKFSAFLEKLRISNACNLLKSSDMSIEDISEKSGYNSAHVFRSAFKKIEGVSPSVYRDRIKK